MPNYLYILSLSNLLKFTSFGWGVVENKLVDKKFFFKKNKDARTSKNRLKKKLGLESHSCMKTNSK